MTYTLNDNGPPPARQAYRQWVCAAVFQRCEGNSPSGPILRPCRSLCLDAFRKCPAATLALACPATDTRDYGDGDGPPACNMIGTAVTAA
jgi:hypothetical protein